MRGSLPLVVVLVLAALVAWLAWPKEVSVAPGDAPANAAARTAAAEASVAAAAKPAEPGDAVAAERQAAPTGAGAVPPTVAGPLVEVRVVDGGTGAAVADATVHWLPWNRMSQSYALPRPERDYLLYYDQAALAARDGIALRSDAEGKVRVALEQGGGALHAVVGDRYGSLSLAAEVAAPEGGWQLRLEPDCKVRIRVVDARGLGRAGVPVELRALDTAGKRMQMVYLPPLPSGPDGMLTLPHSQAWLRPNGRPMAEASRWSVAAMVPGHDDPGIAFAPQAPPSEPIELRLPATGTIVGSVIHQGRRLTQGVDLQVWRGSERDSANEAVRVPVGTDGFVRVGAVALGGELVVRANLGVGSLTQTVAAPRGDGEVVQVEFTTERLYVLAGTLVGPDDQLLQNRTVQTDFDLQVTMGNGSVTTDERGRFEWFLTEGYVDRAQIQKLVFSIVPVGESPLSATLAPREMLRGVTDLGVIKLDRGPLVVAGRIEADGKPARGQWWVLVERVSERRNRDGSERWEQVEGLTRGYFEDGRFEFRGETTAAKHRLRLPGDDHLPVPPIEFAVGAKDLQLRVQAGHVLRAEVLVPDAVSPQSIRGVLRPRFEPPAEVAADRDRMERDRYTVRGWSMEKGRANMAWSGLPAGTYDLELRTAAATTPALVVGDLVLPPPNGGDKRLQAIDLRALVRTVQLDVAFGGESSEPRRHDHVQVFGQPQPDPQRWFGDLVAPGGTLTLPTGATELLVCSSGYAPNRVTVPAADGSASRLAVELTPWPVTELVFEGLPELPAGIELLAQLREEGRPTGNPASFRTEGMSGPLAPLLTPNGRGEKAVGGKARVTLGEGANRLAIYLLASRPPASATVQLGSGPATLPGAAPRPVALKAVQPAQLVGPSAGTVGVRLDPAEVAAVIATLQAGK